MTFEKCTFFNCDFGITVGVGGQVLLLDCVFTNCGTGLSVVNGGRVIAKHCDFLGCQRGARIGGRHSSGEFFHCSFLDNCHDGITATDGATLLADGCRVADCDGIGIIFEGPKRIFGRVTNTAVTKCNKSAVYIRDGKIDVVLQSCKFTENKNGLITQWNVVGYVDLNGCVFFEVCDGGQGTMERSPVCGDRGLCLAALPVTPSDKKRYPGEPFHTEFGRTAPL